MDATQTSSANDIFSLSDQTLADRLQFIEEIGYGNWGSVWRCCPKPDPSSKSPPNKYEKVKLAVKLVHRSKTQTTAARVRSLWNEMKVVRSLKDETHPSIIPFYSFIITPSYALITMAYIPRLIPVEVDEHIAKVWFKSLLSGVEFLHTRGVVHNDIKPANILLSDKDVPVLVDFGFAEKYDLGSSKAFRSNLAYGTPEYLSPERARGHHHDTRKSDVWSLGITFFEILVGRTPFEHVEGEQFSTKEDLEKYWARTVRGKWIGSYKMSRAIEKLIRRMVAPNADVRCFASEALDDLYWVPKEALKAIQKSAHRKSASLSQAALSAMNIDVDTSRLLDIVSPFTTRTLKDRKGNNKENLTKTLSATPIGKSDTKSDFVMVETSETLKKIKVDIADQSPSFPSANPSSKTKHMRSQSQPKTAVKSVLNTPESSTISTANKLVARTPVFVPLESIEGSTTPEQVVNDAVSVTSRIPLPRVTAHTDKVRPTSRKENSGVKEPRASKPKTTKENALVNAPQEGKTKKPTGPRKPPPTLTPKKAIGNENAITPKKPPTTITRGGGRVLGDLSNMKGNSNILDTKSQNSNTQSPFTSPERTTSFFTSPDTGELSMNLNIHGDSYATESVWLNHTTDIAGKSQNENSFASLGKGSVKERWMDWERERERLREMDKDKIRETDDEDTNRLRRSIMTVVSEPEPDVSLPLEIDLDATLEFAPGFRTSGETSRPSGTFEMREDIPYASAKTEGKKSEAEVFGRRRDSQGSRILQTLLAAEPVAVHPPQVQPESEAEPQAERSPGLRNGLPVPRSLFGSGLSALKQNVKASIDKSVQLYRTSILLGHNNQSTTITAEDSSLDHTRIEQSVRQPWEDESLIRQADSSLPGVRQMVRTGRVGEDNNMDRMTLWLQSVEKVVADARQNFEAARPIQPISLTPAPPPARRPPQRKATQRMPRKILAANQIFNENGEASTGPETPDNAPTTANSSTLATPEPSQVSVIVEETSALLSQTPPTTPARRRRATVVTMSPEIRRTGHDVAQESPSKRSLLCGQIFPRAELERELERLNAPTPPVRLSALVHPSVFIAPRSTGPEVVKAPIEDIARLSPHSLSPPPGRTITGSRSLDSPNTKRRVADDYDRLLSATAGVKKVGLGYQSDVRGPVANVLNTDPYPSSKRITFFHSTRRAMPPPVSSNDWRKTASVDELARIMPSTPEPISKEEKVGGTVSAMKRAFMAFTGRTGSKRLSQRLT